MNTRRSRNSRIDGRSAARRANERGLYVHGSAVRQLDMTSPMDIETRRAKHFKARRSREKAAHMNPAYVIFLAVMLTISAAVLISYVRLRSDITSSISHISALENQLNSLKQSNDEEYSRVENSVSLEEVKRIAIEELGMTYAAEGQVVLYDSTDTDYVRQVAEVPVK